MAELRVIGTLVDSPSHYVLMDQDGRFFEYDHRNGRIRPMRGEERWQVSVVHNVGLIIDVEFTDEPPAVSQ